MPDNNRFAGLSDVVEADDVDDDVEAEEDHPEQEADDSGTDEAGEHADGHTATAAGAEADATAADESASVAPDDTNADDDGPEPDPDEAPPATPAEAGPAFEFDDTTAKSIYVREETLATLEDTEFEVESLLRREHGVRDATGREFHDAAVRVLADHVEEIADMVIDTRVPDDE